MLSARKKEVLINVTSVLGFHAVYADFCVCIFSLFIIFPTPPSYMHLSPKNNRSILGLHNLVHNKMASKQFLANEAKEAAEAKKAKLKELKDKEAEEKKKAAGA